MHKRGNYKGLSYAKRVSEVNAIYDEHSRSGLSNREIWRRFIYPRFAISEKTFYNYLNASADEQVHENIVQLELFDKAVF